MAKVQIKRGNKANLPTLAQGELGLALDTAELFIGGSSGNVNINSTTKDIPAGGTKGQILKKKSNTDRDVEWGDIPPINELSSYMAFCANVNTESLDVAFGKGIDRYISNLGRQMALYSYFKGVSPIDKPYTLLNTKQRYSEILADDQLKKELIMDDILLRLIMSSKYAVTLFEENLPQLPDKVVYNNGDLCIPNTGGWIAETTEYPLGSGNITFDNATHQMELNTTARKGNVTVAAIASTVNPINIRGYKYIHIEYTLATSSYPWTDHTLYVGDIGKLKYIIPTANTLSARVSENLFLKMLQSSHNDKLKIGIQAYSTSTDVGYSNLKINKIRFSQSGLPTIN